MSTPTHDRRAVTRAAGLILLGSLGIQSSSALSERLFAFYGTMATSSLRMALAAVLLLVVVRPKMQRRSRNEWMGIIAYGVSMAAMNLCLYVAIDRLPLGIAVTLDFLGPCAVAFAASRHVKEAVCALIAAGGVTLISLGPGGYFDVWGYLAGLGAAAFFGLYTLSAARVGQAADGLDGLALSVTVAALVTMPVAVTNAAQVHPHHWALLLVSAVVGVAIPYSVDTMAGRLTSARIIGTLFAIDPAMGSLIGLLVLHERLSLTAVAGVALVALSGALLVWSSESATTHQT